MREQVTISGIFKKDVGVRLFGQLVATFPAGQKDYAPHVFEAKLDRSDRRVDKLVELLEKNGIARSPRFRTRGEREYVFRIRRIYTESDLEQSMLLCLGDTYPIGDVWENEANVCEVQVSKLPKKADFVYASPFYYFVSDHFRQCMASNALLGFDFRPLIPVKVKDGTDRRRVLKWDDVAREPWWELESSKELPPLSPTTDARNPIGERVPRSEWSKGILVVEEPYEDSELHYRKQDLPDLASFDIARTHERICGASDCSSARLRNFIVSNRVYQVCRDNGINLPLTPVRIES